MNRTHTHRSGASRRAFLGRVASAGTVLGAGLLSPKSAHAANAPFPTIHDGARPNPIPGGLAPFAPFGIFIHHNPLKPGVPVADINDPSQITDFDGFVGLTHIRGGGTGTNTVTGCHHVSGVPGGHGVQSGQLHRRRRPPISVQVRLCLT